MKYLDSSACHMWTPLWLREHLDAEGTPVMPKRHPLVLLAAAAAGVPDALVVYDGDGNLIGWDESAAERYLDENGRVF